MRARVKKAVVTGGAGFIGSHIADALVTQGYEVIVVDDLSTGSTKNIADVLKQPTAELVEGSITDLPLLTKLFRGVEYVFHQAALASVPASIKNPQASHDVNATGILNVLMAARDSAVKKVIYASSCAVYGDTSTQPLKEDMLPKPQSPYAVTKLAGEYYCAVFHRAYGLPTISLRYFNVYGPRQDPASEYAAVVPSFIQRVLTGRAPVIYGDGEQTRDFVFIADVVKANITMAQGEATGTFNVGRGDSISIGRLADTVIRLAEKNMKAAHEASRQGDLKHSLADITKARHVGYEPEYTLEMGLRETTRCFQHTDSGSDSGDGEFQHT